jgi:hypothetical protein
MSHCGKIGYALQATVADLVISYGLLNGMKQYSKILYPFLRCGTSPRIWLCAMGPNAVFYYALRAIAQDLVMCYGPLRRIWLCAMGHRAKRITRAQKYTTDFKSLPYPLKRP